MFSAGGLLGLALAWTLTTTMGYVAIKRGLIAQHRDWMIRSYVVACSFVFFRAFIDLVHSLGIRSGSATVTGEEYKLAAWLCCGHPPAHHRAIHPVALSAGRKTRPLDAASGVHLTHDPGPQGSSDRPGKPPHLIPGTLRSHSLELHSASHLCLREGMGWHSSGWTT